MEDTKVDIDVNICPECRTEIKPGQIHSAHGWTDNSGILVEEPDTVDPWEGRAMFWASELSMLETLRRGRPAEFLPSVDEVDCFE
jgi:hypothetical protein